MTEVETYLNFVANHGPGQTPMAEIFGNLPASLEEQERRLFNLLYTLEEYASYGATIVGIEQLNERFMTVSAKLARARGDSKRAEWLDSWIGGLGE